MPSAYAHYTSTICSAINSSYDEYIINAPRGRAALRGRAIKAFVKANKLSGNGTNPNWEVISNGKNQYKMSDPYGRGEQAECLRSYLDEIES